MRIRSPLLVVEFAIILLVSLAAGYALLGTSRLFLIPFAALLVLGVATVMILSLGAFVFGAGAVVMTLPTLMKLNGVKWWLFTPEGLDFCPTLSFPQALTMGLFVISGSLALGYLQTLWREVRMLHKARADQEEIGSHASGQLLAISAAVLVGALVSTAMVVVIGATRGILTSSIEGLTWVLPVAGTVSLTVLALAIFWLAASKKTNKL